MYRRLQIISFFYYSIYSIKSNYEYGKIISNNFLYINGLVYLAIAEKKFFK